MKKRHYQQKKDYFIYEIFDTKPMIITKQEPKHIPQVHMEHSQAKTIFQDTKQVSNLRQIISSFFLNHNGINRENKYNMKPGKIQTCED